MHRNRHLCHCRVWSGARQLSAAPVGSLMQGGQGNSTNNAANDAKHDSPAPRTQAMRHVRFACLGGGGGT
jgi:hypothetical protein